MRLIFWLVVFSVTVSAQQQLPHSAAIPEQGANLPAQPIGATDLIAVSVYDAPELSRTIRVSADRYIRLPMLQQRIHAEGLYPADLEVAIAKALQAEQILNNPFVTVTIAA